MKVAFENSSTGIYFNCSLNEMQQENNECAVNFEICLLSIRKNLFH